MKPNKKAFTLIELLVVIAIIGTLATISVIALSNARAKARDTKRIADTKQVSTALEMFFNDNNRYPTDSEFNSGQIGSSTTTVYMYNIPQAPVPNDGDCSSDQNSFVYRQTEDGRSYTVSMCLGNNTGSLDSGPKCLTPVGVVDIDCSPNCTDTTWTINPNAVCNGESYTQTSNCGNTRLNTGTLTCSSGQTCTNGVCGCVDTTWNPDPNTVCNGEGYTQTSNCGATQSNTGTLTCSTGYSCHAGACAVNQYSLTYTAGSHGSLSGQSSQTVNYNSSGSSVSAVADFGHHFVNWSDNSTANPRTDSNVTGNISVTANFAADPSVCTVNSVDYAGENYPVVSIGTQCWFAKNLRTAKYNDDSNINLIDDSSWSNPSGAYTWYNNNYNTYGAVYGALYNLYAVKTNKLCPVGWHVPTEADWIVLKDLVSSYPVGILKAATPLWNGNNISGFNALPAGFGYSGGSNFGDLGSRANFWSSSGSISEGRVFNIYQNLSPVIESYWPLGRMSIRCLQN